MPTPRPSVRRRTTRHASNGSTDEEASAESGKSHVAVPASPAGTTRRRIFAAAGQVRREKHSSGSDGPSPGLKTE